MALLRTPTRYAGMACATRMACLRAVASRFALVMSAGVPTMMTREINVALPGLRGEREFSDSVDCVHVSKHGSSVAEWK